LQHAHSSLLVQDTELDPDVVHWRDVFKLSRSILIKFLFSNYLLLKKWPEPWSLLDVLHIGRECSKYYCKSENLSQSLFEI
jgi:hypothetical protein